MIQGCWQSMVWEEGGTQLKQLITFVMWWESQEEEMKTSFNLVYWKTKLGNI